jgi:hypothetical protein
MNVLGGCEMSAIVRDAFRQRGHNAWSCDLSPTLGNSATHIQGDIFGALHRPPPGIASWDLFIGHPPCTFLCNSGNQHLYIGKSELLGRNEQRWSDMRVAAQFFSALYSVDVPRVCIENPIMHRYAAKIINIRASQLIHPWQFGHGETKATYLWLRNLPHLQPTYINEDREHHIHNGTFKRIPGLTRSQMRSLTYRGIATAMADQWGAL